MVVSNHWIARNTKCAQAWREPRWRLQLLPTGHNWLHATLPGILPAAVAVTTVVVKAVSVAAVHLPPGHGA
jgi:hypothetical protein